MDVFYIRLSNEKKKTPIFLGEFHFFQAFLNGQEDKDVSSSRK